MVEETVRRLRGHPDPRSIAARLVVLDTDRLAKDRQAGRDALAASRKAGLRVVRVNPNLEGLLVRLHEQRERRRVNASDASKQLWSLWSTYSKSKLSAYQLRQRFSLGDLERAARHDDELRGLLSILGLIR